MMQLPGCWLPGMRKDRNAIMEGARCKLSLINLSCLIPFPTGMILGPGGFALCPKVMRKKNSHCRNGECQARVRELQERRGPLKLHCRCTCASAKCAFRRCYTHTCGACSPQRGPRSPGWGIRDQLGCWKRPPESPGSFFFFSTQVATTHLEFNSGSTTCQQVT